jgi:hypothetical protein
MYRVGECLKGRRRLGLLRVHLSVAEARERHDNALNVPHSTPQLD